MTPPGLATLIGLEAVERQCAFLADGSAAAALTCQSLPIALRGSGEGLGLVLALKELLQAAPLALQVLVEVGPLDVDAFVAAHRRASDAEAHPLLRRLAERQRRFVDRLADDRQLLERRTYLVLQLPANRPARGRWPWSAPAPPRPADRAAQAGRLAGACLELCARLTRAHIASRRLSDHELTSLLYRQFAPALAERQPLPARLEALATGPVDLAAAVAIRRPSPLRSRP